MMKRLILKSMQLYSILLIGLIAFCPVSAQQETDGVLKVVAGQIHDSIFQEVFQHPKKYRLQIIYTQIDRDAQNLPHFKRYTYHADPGKYFNPASTVKMPLAALALKKLHGLKEYGIDLNTIMLTDSSYDGQTTVLQDSTSANLRPSIAQYIKKIFLVSDNDAYNRLYEFLGQQYINRQLHHMGYKDAHITRRFFPMNAVENRHTNAIRFIDRQGKLLYLQKPAYNQDAFQYGPVIQIGTAYMNSNDSLINGPWDFTEGNRISLSDLTTIEQSILFPQSIPGKRGFELFASDRRFLLQYMSQYPGETKYPKYDSSVFYDSFTKFYFRGGGHELPGYIRVFNKPGWSYGFLTDIAYIADFKNKVEFMLSCTLYVNSGGVINDNHYDYETIGFPFLYALGQGIYQYELKRKRKYPADLREFQIQYEQRDATDNRPLIREADN